MRSCSTTIPWRAPAGRLPRPPLVLCACALTCTSRVATAPRLRSRCASMTVPAAALEGFATHSFSSASSTSASSSASTPVPFLALMLSMGVLPPHSSGTRLSSNRPCLGGGVGAECVFGRAGPAGLGLVQRSLGRVAALGWPPLCSSLGAVGVGAGLVDLVDRHDDGHVRRLVCVERRQTSGCKPSAFSKDTPFLAGKASCTRC